MPYHPKMQSAIDEAFEAFRDFGIRCEKNFSCCTTCGSAEMGDTKNYIFYHEQDVDRIRGGDTDLYLAHNLEDDTIRQKVLDYCKGSPNLYWSGDEMTKIYLSCVGTAKKEKDAAYDAATEAPKPVVKSPSAQETRWFGETNSLRFTILGDKVFAGNKATGRAVPLTLKQLTQFGDHIPLYSNMGGWLGGYWGQGPLLRDYIEERRAAKA